MAIIKQNTYGTLVSVMTTELNSLASGARALSSSFGGDTTAADLYGDFELVVTFGVSPSTGATVDLYLLRAADGTNFSDGSSSVAPPNSAFVGAFEIRAVTSAQRIVLPDIVLPPGLWKALIVNSAGQAMAASGNTLKMRPHSLQTV
jgi:hypothetical protein